VCCKERQEDASLEAYDDPDFVQKSNKVENEFDTRTRNAISDIADFLINDIAVPRESTLVG